MPDMFTSNFFKLASECYGVVGSDLGWPWIAGVPWNGHIGWCWNVVAGFGYLCSVLSMG